MQTIQEQAQRILEILAQYDETRARIHAQKMQSLNIKLRDGNPEVMRHTQHNGIEIELFCDGRYAQFATSDLRDESLQTFLARAVELTRALQPDPYWQLPDPKYYPDLSTLPDLDLYDPKVAELSSKNCLDLALEAELAARQYGNEKGHFNLARSHLTVGHGQSFTLTSNGLNISQRSSMLSMAVEASFQNEQGEKPSDYAYAATRHLKNAPSARDIGIEAVDRTLAQLNRKQADSGRYTLVFENRVASDMINAFLSPLSGKAIEQKASYFLDKLGQRVANNKLTITDNPHLKRGLGSHFVDREGLAGQPRTLVDQGILQHYLLSVYDAAKLGMTPTSASTSNLIVNPGDRDCNAILADCKRAILVTGLLGGNMDATRGDFSHGVQGILYENGQPVHALTETNMSDNHTKLWDRLVEIGNDPNPYDTTQCPTLVFDDIAISGK